MPARFGADDAGIAAAAARLIGGGLVAFGTETVYGLGGRADSAAAVAAIYAAKQRPAGNPLICHYPDLESARVDAEFGPVGLALAAAFWPGPLTLVLPRAPGCRIAANAGPPDTLAVRVPGHDAARALLRAVGVPIAAPSANPSGGLSPTTAHHVLAGLGEKIDAVLDCGPCPVGIESTVLNLSGPYATLLRPGRVTVDEIEALIGPLGVPGDEVVRGPGLLGPHYAPRAALRLNALCATAEEGFLAFGEGGRAQGPVFQLSTRGDLTEAAARLFTGLRLLDDIVLRRGLSDIAVMPIPNEGIGVAINDRLARAALRT